MTSRIENIENKIKQLQAQLQQAKAVNREKERKKRTRQSIIGFTTLQACLEQGIEIHLKSPADLVNFLKENVKGRDNRKTWGFDVSDSEPANSQRADQSQPTSVITTPPSSESTPSHRRTFPLPEGQEQEELLAEFNL